MAVPFLHNIDLNQNELLNAKIHTDSSAPSNPGTGSVWFDTNTNLLKIYRGGNWDNLFVKTEAIADGGTNLATADQIHTFVTAGSLTLTNKTIDVDNNTVSNIEVDNFKSGVLDTDISSVAGTDTTLASAKAIKTYVDAQVTAQDLDFSGDSGTGSVDLDSQTFAITGATGITTTASGQGLSIDLDDTANDMTSTNSGVYGSATAIPVITVDRQGRLTAATTAAISTTLTVDGDSGSEDLALATDDLQILGTTGEIDVAVTKVSTDVKATIGLADTITGNRTFSNNVTVSGNLIVNGTTTTVNSNTVNIGDNIIVLNADETGTPSQDAGIEVERGDQNNARLYYDESTGRWSQRHGTGTEFKLHTEADTISIGDGGTGATTAAAAFTNLKQAATTTATGVVELATATEAKNGSGSGKVVDASQIGARSVVATIDVSDSTFTSNRYAEITHNLGTTDTIVQLYDTSTEETVYADVARTDKSDSTSANKVKITFGGAGSTLPTNDIRVVIVSNKGASSGTVAYS